MEIKLLREEAEIPAYGTDLSAGVDLQACIDEKIVIGPRQCKLIPTGISIFIDNPNIVGKIYPRSGKGHKEGKVLGNLVGIIDADFQQEIMVSLWNRTHNVITIDPGERIAQILFEPIVRPTFDVVEQFSSVTNRRGGFGSTGG